MTHIPATLVGLVSFPVPEFPLVAPDTPNQTPGTLGAPLVGNK